MSVNILAVALYSICVNMFISLSAGISTYFDSKKTSERRALRHPNAKDYQAKLQRRVHVSFSTIVGVG